MQTPGHMYARLYTHRTDMNQITHTNPEGAITMLQVQRH